MARLDALPMVGREEELTLLRAALEGGRGAVVVTGPAGVGKSRLVAEAVANVSAVRAGASPVAPVPFGVARDLVRLAPGGSDHGELVRAYAGALRALPATAVVVEDLHWSDEDSLAVLVEHARTGAGPVLLATTRDEPTRPLVAALGRLTGLPPVRMLALPGLDVAGVAALVRSLTGRSAPVRAVRELHRRTEGRPFWVQELAGTAAGPDLARTGDLPPFARAGLLERVDAAGPDARRVAEVCAVLADEVDATLAAAVLGRSVADLVRPLRTLIDGWILVERPVVGPGSVAPLAFRHELTREAIAGRVPAPERRDWHGRAYRFELDRGADAATLARHAAGAGRSATAAEAALRGAAERFAGGSGAEALRLAELALDAGLDPPWPAHRLAAWAAHRAGYHDDAARHADRWSAQAPTADAHCLRAELRWQAGDPAGQWAALDSALAALPADAPDEATVAVLAARATALMRAERHAEAVREADRTIAAAEACDAAAIVRTALVDKGTALLGLGRTDEGAAVLTEAVAACEAAGDRSVLLRALNNGLGSRLADRPAAEAWAVFDDTWRRATAVAGAAPLGKLARQGVDLAWETADWDRGWRLLDGRLELEPDPVERVVLGVKAVQYLLAAGRVAEAVPMAERAVADAVGMSQFWVRAYLGLADVALTAATAPAAATTRALTRYRQALRPDAHAMRSHRVWEAARYALDGGVPAGTVRAFIAATLTDGLPPALTATADLALAEARGDLTAAVAAGERLLTTPQAHRLGAVERADALIRLARAQAGLGRATDAAAHADEAAALLRAWPGERRHEARRLSMATGAPDPRLTDRERDVHTLLVTGLSNRDIARRLEVSPRTVAVHVSRLLAKTGCRSRTELTARALSAPAP